MFCLTIIGLECPDLLRNFPDYGHFRETFTIMLRRSRGSTSVHSNLVKRGQEGRGRGQPKRQWSVLKDLSHTCDTRLSSAITHLPCGLVPFTVGLVVREEESDKERSVPPVTLPSATLRDPFLE